MMANHEGYLYTDTSIVWSCFQIIPANNAMAARLGRMSPVLKPVLEVHQTFTRTIDEPFMKHDNSPVVMHEIVIFKGILDLFIGEAQSANVDGGCPFDRLSINELVKRKGLFFAFAPETEREHHGLGREQPGGCIRPFIIYFSQTPLVLADGKQLPLDALFGVVDAFIYLQGFTGDWVFPRFRPADRLVTARSEIKIDRRQRQLLFAFPIRTRP